MNEWVEVATARDRNEAKLMFEKWQKENQEWSRNLSENDIRLDIIRTREKTNIFRYQVKKWGSSG